MTWPKLTPTALVWSDPLVMMSVIRLVGVSFKKSLRAVWSVMKRLPVDFPPDRTCDDKLNNLLAKMGSSRQANDLRRKTEFLSRVDHRHHRTHRTFVGKAPFEERSVKSCGARTSLARSGRFLPPGPLRADVFCVFTAACLFFDEPVAYFFLSDVLLARVFHLDLSNTNNTAPRRCHPRVVL